jgi:hypothetical protein
VSAPKKALVVRKKAPPSRRKAPSRAQKVKLEPVERTPLDTIHEVVHHIGAASRGIKKLYDVAKPHLNKLRKKKG